VRHHLRQAGDPIALLSEKGDLYILMGIKDHDPAKDMLIEKMADNVTVEGTLVKKGGVQAIYVPRSSKRPPFVVKEFIMKPRFASH